MKKLRIYLILLLFSLVGSLSAQGQRITLTGIVNDSITQEPIEFITIQEKGQQTEQSQILTVSILFQ